MSSERVLRPRKAQVMASSSNAKVNDECWLLRLPPEILVLITQFVVALNTSPYPLSRLHSEPNSLFNFSLCNKAIRDACRSAGLFSQLTAPSETKKCLPTDFEKLVGGIPWTLASLGVDLSNPEVWEICAHVMGMFPDLDGLVLLGSPQKRKMRFLSSEIGSKFAAFKGTSVTLKRARFTKYQSPVLFHLNRSNVSTFNFIQSEFVCPRPRDFWDRRETLFPKLQVFVFSGLRKFDRFFLSEFFNRENLFASLFGNAPNLKYFEFTSGSTPRLLKDREWERRGWVAGYAFDTYWNMRTRDSVFTYLQRFARNSLEVFVDADGLSGPFQDHCSLLGTNEPPFKEMKLLVFRCENPEILTSYEGNHHDCTVGRFFSEGETVYDLRETHSVWYHVEAHVIINGSRI